jgi:murein DD-endopeptidase MepM/ murein hydrolase activator NlpD
MSTFTNAYQTNPFEARAFTRARKVVFALDQVSRFRQLDATAFAARISATEAAAQALSQALAGTNSALDQQLAATAGTDAALEAVRKVISAEYAVLKSRQGGADSPTVLRIFGSDIEDYTRGLTHTNAADRLLGLRQNLIANPDVLAVADAQRIKDAIGTYTGNRSDQTDEKGTVAQHRATTDDAETAIDAVLWLNQAAIISTYSLAVQQPQRDAAANYSLLYRPGGSPQPVTYADYLAAGATVHVRADEPADELLPAPATRLVLRNPGPVRIQVALSASATAFPPTGSVEIAPGTTATLTLVALGDPVARPYLLAHNPTSELAQFTIMLG